MTDHEFVSIEGGELEKALGEGFSHLQTLLENSPTAIQIHSPDGILRQANKAWEKLWGLKAGDVTGRFNILKDRQAIQLGLSRQVDRALGGESTILEDFVFDPAKSGYPGRKHWARSRIFPLIDKNNTVRNIIIAHEDITAYKQTEERYQIIIENANEAIMVVQDSLLKFFNQKALDIAGYTREEDYAGKPFVDFVHPDYREMIAERHRKRTAGEEVPNFYQIKVLHKNGHSVWLQLNVTRIDWEGKPASFAFISDISDLKRAEEELAVYRYKLEQLVAARTRELELKNQELLRESNERQQAQKALQEHEIQLQRRLFEHQKAESIATLAGGVAHEFNNILMSVLGSAELMQRKMPPEDDNQKYAGMIIKAVRRMTHLTRQLLAYAKGGNYQPKKILLNSIVKESLAISHMRKGETLKSRLECADTLWPVFADPGQIGQMLVNLFTNAFEAMEDTGGCLTVRISNVVKSRGWEDLFHKEHPAGEYVCIQISDTGAGIPKELRERIFEPFFTTKFPGCGLGLAVVAGIAQNHGGSILLESRPQQGTTFSILFRRAEPTDMEGPATK